MAMAGTGRRDTKPSALTIALGALLLLAGLGVVWVVVRAFAAYLRTVQSDLAVALIAAVLAGVGSVITLVLTKRYETKASVRESIRSKKVPVYEELVSMFFRILNSSTPGSALLNEAELRTLFITSTEKLTIWGSEELIASFVAFRENLSTGKATGVAAMFELEDLLLAVRKDLGHSNEGLARGDILRMFVTDIDKHLIPKKDVGTSTRPSAQPQ